MRFTGECRNENSKCYSTVVSLYYWAVHANWRVIGSEGLTFVLSLWQYNIIGQSHNIITTRALEIVMWVNWANTVTVVTAGSDSMSSSPSPWAISVIFAYNCNIMHRFNPLPFCSIIIVTFLKELLSVRAAVSRLQKQGSFSCWDLIGNVVTCVNRQFGNLGGKTCQDCVRRTCPGLISPWPCGAVAIIDLGKVVYRWGFWGWPTLV